MKRTIVLLLVSFALLSCIEGAFVFDRRLLNSTRRRLGRDFSGSIRYGSFSYLGTCPTGSTSALSFINVKKASPSATCFTSSSTGAADPIGYICQPTSGGSGIIHFGYPGTDGFVIGGAYFGGSGSADTISGGTSFKWGSVGAPSYSNEESDSCTASCTANYCTTTCTASCTATATASSASCTTLESTGSETIFFVPSGAASGISNCGQSDACCATGTNLYDYDFCRSENIFTGSLASTFDEGPTSSEGTGEYGIKFTPSVDGVISAVTFNAEVDYPTARTINFWSSGTSSIASYTGETGSGFLRKILNPPLTVTSGVDYIVSFQTDVNGPDSFHYFNFQSSFTNGRHLTFKGAFNAASMTKPSVPYSKVVALDVVFNPCS